MRLNVNGVQTLVQPVLSPIVANFWLQLYILNRREG